MTLYRGVESVTLLSISVSMAVIKDFSTYYMKAQGLNQAYMVLEWRNNYHIVLVINESKILEPRVNMIDNRKYITAITKKFYVFSYWITRMIFDWYWKR